MRREHKLLSLTTVVIGLLVLLGFYSDVAGKVPLSAPTDRLSAAAQPALPRDFALPSPLFAPDSAWNQPATGAAVLPESDQQILVTYRVLHGDTTSLYPPGSGGWFPVMWVNHDEYTMPVFRAGAGQQNVLICDYDGTLWWPSPKFGIDQEGGPVPVPAPADTVRPASPQGTDSDGHLVLYHPNTFMAYDFWQATTQRSGECESRGAGYTGTAILEAGAVDFFDVRGPGTNPDTYSSARAVGTPLLAGLLLPEDVESGAISHALAFAIPGPRNLSSDPYEPLPSDYFYPASTTETDYYNTNPNALAAGQRIRLKQAIVDEEGDAIDEDQLAPITRMFLAALRTYGAYLVDNAGGFIFYAEDIHTADLHLTDDQVNALIGESPGTPLPAGKTKWQIVMEKLNEELVMIPFAYGTLPANPAQATVETANFEVVEPAATPAPTTVTPTPTPTSTPSPTATPTLTTTTPTPTSTPTATPTPTDTPTPTATPTPATTTPTPTSTPTVETVVDQWALWTGGTRLRGANIWQRRVYPELDGPDFMGPGPVGPPYTQQDFDQLAALGANYVNISHPGLFTETPPYILDQDIQDNLDNLLAMIAQADMFAVISFRTGPGRSEFTFIWEECCDDWFDASYLNDSMWQDQAAQDAWVAMWRHTAQRYRGNPIVAGYDLMVEPNSNEVGSDALNPLDMWDPEEFYAQYGGTLYDWNQLYPRITTAIREVDADTPILIGGMAYSAVEWLPYLQPTGDPRTVYMVHQYEPMRYTHQWWDTQDCTYPGMCDVDWDGVPDLFNQAWLDNLLSTVDTFTATHGVPVAVNEFGLMRWEPGAADFMDDQMDLFEQRGMNHALWRWHPSWEPQAELDDFDFLRGPDPNNHTDVQSSDLIDVIVEHWGHNTIRPSSATCPDFSGDGLVNLEDIQTVATRWRMTSADPNWDPSYDLDADGDIDVVDIMRVAARWGDTCN